MNVDDLLERLRAEAELVAGTWGRQQPVQQPWPPAKLSDSFGSVRAQDFRAELQRQLLQQAAAPGRYWLMDDAGYIELLYRDLLDRTPDADGAQHWLGRLQAGMPRLELWLELYLAQERLQVHGGGLRTQLAALLQRALRTHALGRYLRALARRLERRLRRSAARSPLAMNLQAALLAAKYAEEVAQAQEAKMLGLEAGLQALEQRLARLVPGFCDDAEVTAYLAALEQAFRGDTDALRERLESDYGAVLEQAWAACAPAVCLDLGCGRGAWLQALAARGLPALGVDANPEAVAQARQAGLAVELDDVLAWLQRQPDESAALVTALHLMEHLSLPMRLAVARESARVLQPGGVLIMETPNPENVWVGTHTFYNDPTHTQPLTPDGLAFLARYVGLEVVAVPRLHPYPEQACVPESSLTAQRLNGMTCGGQDFAVVARKPAPVQPGAQGAGHVLVDD